MKTHFLILVMILGFRLAALALSPEQFEAIVSLNSEVVTVPDPIILTVELRYPVGYAPDLMTMKQNLAQQLNPLLPQYRVISETVEPPKLLNEQGYMQTVSYMIEPLSLGTLSFSLLNVPFVPIEGKNQKNAHQAFSDIRFVRVEAPQPIKTSPTQIGFPAPLLHLKPDLPLSLTLSNRERFLNDPTLLADEAVRNQRIFYQRSFPWMLLLLLGGIAIFIAGWRQLQRYLAWKRQQRPLIDPRKKAAESTVKLFIKKGDEGSYYDQLSEILRTYIEEAFHIHVHEQTTEEFLDILQKNPAFSPAVRQSLARVFYTGDLVKFAHYRPSQQECEEALATVKGLLE